MDKTIKNPPRDDAQDALIMLGTASVDTKGGPFDDEGTGGEAALGISDQ